MKIFVKILTTAQQIIYNFYINKIFFQEFCLGNLTELLTYAIIIVILKVPNKKRREMSKIEKENVTTKEVEYSLKDIDDKILLNLRDLGMRLRFLYDGKDSQRRALVLLLKSGSMSQRELTDRLDIKPGSMSEVLNKLDNKGLIERSPLESDKRTAMVSLTEDGTKKALQALEYRTEKRLEMFSALDDDEKITLLLLLERINDNL